MDSYTNQQIEVANLLRAGTSPDVIDEVLTLMAAAKKSINTAPTKDSDDSEMLLRVKILEEKDWRKRASLSALLISKSLSY